MTRKPLGYIWAKLVRCPECNHTDHGHRGRRGTIRYLKCNRCGAEFKNRAIAQHLDRGGDQSDIDKI